MGAPRASLRHPLTPVPALAPFEKWGIDYIGPIAPASQPRRNKYILLATDYLTKWVEARATVKDDAATTARFLYENILTRFGPPLELVSDRGTHFINETIEQLNDRYLIKHRKTTPYHPQANGLTERANGTIGRILTKIIAAHRSDWDDKLLAAVFAYNSAYKNSTGQTPYFLCFGQRSLVPVELEVPTLRVTLLERLPDSLSLADRLLQLEALEETRMDSTQRLHTQQTQMKSRFDRPL